MHGRLTVSNVTLLALSFGLLYSYPALASTLAPAFDLPRGTLLSAFAAWLIGSALFGPGVGWFVDREGSRRAVRIGGALLALGGAVFAVVPWPALAIAGFIVIGGGGQILVGTALFVIAGTHPRPGRAFAIVGAAVGLGLAVVIPLSAAASDALGWRWAFLMLAAAVTVASVASSPDTASYANGAALEAPAHTVRPLWARLLSRPFAVLFVGGLAIGIVDEAGYQHVVPHLVSRGYTEAAAGSFIGLMSTLYLAGRVLGGEVGDRVPRPVVICVSALALLAGLGLIAAATTDPPPALAGTAAYGLGLGSALTVRTMLLARQFSGPQFGRVLGFYQWAYALGGAAVGWGGGALFDRTGSYVPAFAAAFLATIAWSICMLVAARLAPGTAAPD